jgi:hypothetical protein
MNGLVTELGSGGGTRCSTLRVGPQQLRLQLNDTLLERLAFHRSGRRRELTSSDFGISTGLINQNYWENSKWYYVNVERGNAADKLNGRNINVSFTNNSNVPIEVMIFIFYSDEIAIDVKTGLVTRHKN